MLSCYAFKQWGIYWIDATTAAQVHDFTVQFPIAFSSSYAPIIHNPVMGPATEYAKSELKWSPDKNGFAVRITWPAAVKDRRLAWCAIHR